MCHLRYLKWCLRFNPLVTFDLNYFYCSTWDPPVVFSLRFFILHFSIVPVVGCVGRIEDVHTRCETSTKTFIPANRHPNYQMFRHCWPSLTHSANHTVGSQYSRVLQPQFSQLKKIQGKKIQNIPPPQKKKQFQLHAEHHANKMLHVFVSRIVTDLQSLSLYISIFLFLSLYLCLSVYLSISVCLSHHVTNF